MKNKFDNNENYDTMNHQNNDILFLNIKNYFKIKFDITIKHRYNESSKQRNINKSEYIMNKLKLNDIVIVKFDKNERACLGFVDSIVNDEIVSISNFTTNEQIDEFYHDGTFAHSNDMTIVIKKINDTHLLRLINFDDE